MICVFIVFIKLGKFLIIVTWNIFSPFPLWELQLLYSRSPKVVPQLSNFLFCKKKPKTPFILHDSFWIISCSYVSKFNIFSVMYNMLLMPPSKFYTCNYYSIIRNLIWFFPFSMPLTLVKLIQNSLITMLSNVTACQLTAFCQFSLSINWLSPITGQLNCSRLLHAWSSWLDITHLNFTFDDVGYFCGS